MMSASDRVIRLSTALAVLGVAAIAASHEYAYDLVRRSVRLAGLAHGWATARPSRRYAARPASWRLAAALRRPVASSA